MNAKITGARFDGLGCTDGVAVLRVQPGELYVDPDCRWGPHPMNSVTEYPKKTASPLSAGGK